MSKQVITSTQDQAAPAVPAELLERHLADDTENAHTGDAPSAASSPQEPEPPAPPSRAASDPSDTAPENPRNKRSSTAAGVAGAEAARRGRRAAVEQAEMLSTVRRLASRKSAGESAEELATRLAGNGASYTG